jgi:hypothetical protein
VFLSTRGPTTHVEETNPLGSIEIAPAPLPPSPARRALLLAWWAWPPKRGRFGQQSRTTPRIKVRVDDGQISINVYSGRYGTRVSSVAASVANTVRFNVEKALGAPIGDVNIHVQGLRVSNPDA